MKTLQLEHVELELSGYDGRTVCLSCQYQGARFHTWGQLIGARVDLTRGYMGEAALYKNSLAKHGEPGYYRARKIKTTGTFGAALVAAMLREASGRGLLVFARQALATKEKQEAAVSAALRRERRITGAAPSLFAFVHNLADGLITAKIKEQARQIVEQINTEPQ